MNALKGSGSTGVRGESRRNPDVLVRWTRQICTQLYPSFLILSVLSLSLPYVVCCFSSLFVASIHGSFSSENFQWNFSIALLAYGVLCVCVSVRMCWQFSSSLQIMASVMLAHIVQHLWDKSLNCKNYWNNNLKSYSANASKCNAHCENDSNDIRWQKKRPTTASTTIYNAIANKIQQKKGAKRTRYTFIVDFFPVLFCFIQMYQDQPNIYICACKSTLRNNNCIVPKKNV